MSFPLLFVRGPGCAGERDCRMHPLDFPTFSPGPSDCSQCLRTLSACKCSCLDMFPPHEDSEDIVHSYFVAATIDTTPGNCYCANGEDFASATAGIVTNYSFSWDETYGLNLSQYLITKAAITCPDNPHTTAKVYHSTNATNLACVSSSADWALISTSDPDPEPTGSAPDWAAPSVNVGETGRVDCAATLLLQPLAFLLEFTDACGNTLLVCPTLNPGGVVFTCPPCVQTCPEIDVISDGTSATSCDESGKGECTVTFTINCRQCICSSGSADVTFTLTGPLGESAVTVPGVVIGCGDMVFVSTPDPLEFCGDGQRWRVDISWTCTEEGENCQTPPGCTGIFSCPVPTVQTVFVAIGGGIVPP